MNSKIPGLHHVTAIASDPQRNLDFYVGLLGLRFVKRTVNFDDPGTYHFYFGDRRGTPGTILTFFPWPGARRGIRGIGQIEATAFSISPDSVDYWLERLKQQHVAAERTASRFGEEVIRFVDPDGLLLELIASNSLAPFEHGPIARFLRNMRSADSTVCRLLWKVMKRRRVCSLIHSITVWSKNPKTGFGSHRADDNAPGRIVDLLCLPDSGAGRVAAGSVHHIAFRAHDEQEQLQWRERLVDLGYNVTPVIDRIYFHSIYFREPGGVLFEIATEPPGFTLDETIEELGTGLRLPPWLESARSQIEKVLPAIHVPHKQ